MLKQFELPLDFKANDLLNFIPTCRKPNVDKGKVLPPGMIWHALNESKKKKENIVKRIDDYKRTCNLNELAARIKSNIRTLDDMYNVIDVILDDVYDFVQQEEIISTKRPFIRMQQAKSLLKVYFLVLNKLYLIVHYILGRY